MPSKYTVKLYVENGIYHVYNRGVEKRKIFQEDQDYHVFLHYLKRYLTNNPNEVRPRWKVDLADQIRLISYSLMENHFHLLLQQLTRSALTTFMRCLINSYTKYFNQKYDRIGPLLQGKFKAILVDKDEYLLHLTRYIHLNPIAHFENKTRSDLVKMENAYSSYQDFLGVRNTEWLYPKVALDYFTNPNLTYKKFVEDYTIDSESIIGEYALDSR